MDIDYKALLIKYIKHVRDEEGTSFIEYQLNCTDFTSEEKEELQRMDKLTHY